MKNAISILLSLAFLFASPARAQWAAVLAGSPPAASGSVGIGNRANSGVSGSSPVDISSFTVASTSPLYVFVFWVDAITVTGVTWNTSENLTQVGTKNDSLNLNHVSVWRIASPTATTATIRVTFSGSPGSGSWCAAIGTTGANTSTSERTVFARNDTDGTGPGLTVTDSQNGDLVLDAASVFATTIVFDAGETTTTTTANNPSSIGFSMGMSTKPAVGANTAVGATDQSLYAQVAFAVRP